MSNEIINQIAGMVNEMLNEIFTIEQWNIQWNWQGSWMKQVPHWMKMHFIHSWELSRFFYGSCHNYINPIGSYQSLQTTTPHAPPIPAGIQSFQRNSGGILQVSTHSSGIPRNKTGIKQTKVEILYLTLHILPIYRTTYFSLLSLLFLHLFKSVSHLQSVYSRTLPLGYNF